MRDHGGSRGFTLLEILIAVAIFAILGVMAMAGYTQLSQQSERLKSSMDRVRNIQLTLQRIAQDCGELEPRPVRSALGTGVDAALLSDARNQTLLRLTRAGWSNPVGVNRATLQRVQYRLDDGKLYRDFWPVLDAPLATEPTRVELLDQVREIKLRFLDRNRVWSDQWPALTTGSSAASQAADARPLAVEVTLTLEDWGTITRLIEVPG